MMRRTTFAATGLAATLGLAACGGTAASPTPGAAASGTTARSLASTAVAAPVTAALAANQESHAQADDVEYERSGAVRIALEGTRARVSGKGAKASGGTVTITAAGTYIVSGTLRDGRIVVSSPGDGKVRLVLDGASITSAKGPAIRITEADEVVVVLAAGSTNALRDGTASAADEPSAALASMADLTIGGAGALTVTGTANDGIASKDGLVVLGGRITVTAKDDGIRGKDYLIVQAGTLTVRAGGDGLVSDNEEKADRGYVAVLGGTVTVTAADGLVAATDVIVGGGRITTRTAARAASTVESGTSAKGLKAGTAIVVGSGRIAVTAADDAIHSDGSVTIAGGTLTLATADDGVHAEGTLAITGGSVSVTRSYEGLEASQMRIAGGTVRVVSSDDGINLVAPGSSGDGGLGAGSSAGGSNNLAISGGTITVDAGGDGLDVNGSATMTGGTLVVSGPTEDFNGALDADGGIVVTKGVLVAAGSAGMAVAPETSSAQGWVSVTFAQAVAAGKVIAITDGSTVLATYRTAKATASLVVSLPGIANGKTYGVSVGGTQSGRAIGGYAASGSLTGATRVTTVTAGQHTGGFGAGRGGGSGMRP